ncbi:MAG: pyridoxal-phosphate dependent enzyme, partial [Proteobacteria bacterium]|nr:pyridoxal-phosphate dependent enzyme [Pseudomonadota bacterium]
MNYIDAATGATYPLDKPRWCGDGCAHLNLGDAPGLTRGEIDTTKYSVWRYAKALLVEAKDAVTLGEGWTPLVDGKLDGISVTMKLEFMMPTGSFKDRGMTTLITYLKNRGVMSVLEDSSGNAGASMAAYSAAAGMKARILVPETASYPKIAQMAATGADVVTVKGSRQDVADAALRYAKEIFYASHNWQPFFLEGTKTLAYELWEQFGFKIPDNIVFPVGYGSNVCGCERGFAELKRRGEIDRLPKLFAVQAANCAPLYAAFKAGADEAVPTDVATTVAEGIASSKPTRL